MNLTTSAPRLLIILSITLLAPLGCATNKDSAAPSAPAQPGPQTATTPSVPITLLRKPSVTKDDIARAIKYEKDLSRHDSTKPPEGTPYFEVLPGKSPILILAPHATLPNRGTQHLFPDGGTGSLAVSLHELADATVVTTTWAQPSDPNYSDDNDFKRTVADLLATHQYTLVLDIHGSHQNQAYDIDFGTMNGTSLIGDKRILDHLISCLHERGIINLSQDFFPAAKQQTDTKWSVAHGVPAVQLEINSTCLILATSGCVPDESGLQTHRFAQLLDALVTFVKTWPPARPAP